MRASLVSFDTNVLVYCFQSGDRRQAAALELLRRALGARCTLTLQSLGEFFVVTSRKRLLRPELAREQVGRWLSVFPSPPPPSVGAMRTAMEATLSGRFGYWDALLLATAAEAGCAAVISEDMAPGATLGGVRVVPAFAGDGAAPSPEALAVLGGGA